MSAMAGSNHLVEEAIRLRAEAGELLVEGERLMAANVADYH